MTTTRKAKDANSKGGSKLKRKPSTQHKDQSSGRRTGTGVERVRSDRSSEQRSATVHPLHNGSRAHRSGRQPSNNQAGGATNLRSMREDRGSASGAVGDAGGGSKPNRNILRYKVEPSFVDRAGTALWDGAIVRFFPHHGNVMRSIVEGDHNLGRMISVRFAGDPFPTYVDHRQLQLARGQVADMPRTATAEPTAKELRRQAKTLGVRNWEEMSKEELATAIAEADTDEAPARPVKAKKANTAKTSKRAAVAEGDDDEEPTSKSTKTTAKTAAAARKSNKTTPAATKGKRAAPTPAANGSDGPNPFRAGTNLWLFTEALMVGGKRSALVKKLLPKVKYNPRVQSDSDFDREVETDRRLKVIGYILKNQHGWEYEHEGRGPDAFIKVTPPE